MTFPRAIPAPGYRKVSGKRRPPRSLGERLFCQIRNGICDPLPWPVAGTVWRWDWNEDGTCNPHTGDVVAVKIEDGQQWPDGREADGTYS